MFFRSLTHVLYGRGTEFPSSKRMGYILAVLIAFGVTILFLTGYALHPSLAELLVLSLALLALFVDFVFFYMGTVNIAALVQSMPVSVRYVHEEYNLLQHERYHGLVYQDLVDIVSSAARSIYIVSVQYNHSPHLIGERERHTYYEAIEKRVRRAIDANDKRFEYIRVLQSDPDAEDGTAPYVDPVLERHLEAMKELRMYAEGTKVHIDIGTFTNTVLMPFKIVDERLLVFERWTETIAGGDRPTPYAAGILVIEDRTGDVVSQFYDSFRSVVDLAKPWTGAPISLTKGTSTPPTLSRVE